MWRRLVVLGVAVACLAACKAGKGEPCAKPEDCASGLSCSLNDFKCFSPSEAVEARTAEECRDSKDCEYDGLCDARGRKCIAKACPKNEEACGTWGKCTLKGEICITASSEDCKGATRCTESGACTVVEGECQATNEEDCKASKNCKEKGECSLRPGRGCWNPTE